MAVDARKNVTLMSTTTINPKDFRIVAKPEINQSQIDLSNIVFLVTLGFVQKEFVAEALHSMCHIDDQIFINTRCYKDVKEPTRMSIVILPKIDLLLQVSVHLLHL